MLRARSLLTCVLLAALGGGCRAVLAFPDPRPEGADLESCRDGVDQDLDGAVDCADSDCDGSCTEEPPRCADGRDNDLDGASDTLDPSCWRERAARVERCATIEGTDAVLESGAEFGWAGRAERLEVEGRSYFGASTDAARIAWAVPLSGAVAGTELSFTVGHDGAGRAVIALVPFSSVSDDLLVAPQAAAVRVELEDEAIRVFSGPAVRQLTRAGSPPTDRYEVEITLGPTSTSTFHLQAPGGEATSFAFSSPSAWDDDEPLVLIFEAAAAGSSIWIGDVTVRRPSIEHCGRRVPEMEAAGENALFDASRGAPGVCVLASIDPVSAEPRRLRAYSSEDGVTFEDVGTMEVPGVALGASIAWDPRASAWRGVVAGQDHFDVVVPAPEWARTLSGPDCATLSVGEPLDLPLAGLEAAGVDYAILADGAHRITFDYLAQTAGRYGLREFVSPDGSADRFEVATIDLGDAFNALRFRGALSSIDTVLDQRLVWVELGGEVQLFREQEGARWVQEPIALLEPSSTPGSFDRGRVLGPRAVMEPPPPDGATPWHGRLYYSGTQGAACAGCGRIGSADLTVSP